VMALVERLMVCYYLLCFVLFWIHSVLIPTSCLYIAFDGTGNDGTDTGSHGDGVNQGSDSAGHGGASDGMLDGAGNDGTDNGSREDGANKRSDGDGPGGTSDGMLLFVVFCIILDSFRSHTYLLFVCSIRRCG
jgi:hypothetical protein